jgi:hypothetical protein
MGENRRRGHVEEERGGGFQAGRGWAMLGVAPTRERWCRAGGAHVTSRGAKWREGSGTRERTEGAGRPMGGTVPGVGSAYQ